MNGIEKRLDGMVSRAKNARGYLDRVVYQQYQDAQFMRWQTANASEGSTWKPLTHAYEKYKLKKFSAFPGGGRVLMVATSNLSKSVIGPRGGGSMPFGHRKVVTESSLIVGTTVPYAGFADALRPFTKYSPATMRKIQKGLIAYLKGGK